MGKRIVLLLLAMMLLVGCKSEPAPVLNIHMDELTLQLPGSFVQLNQPQASAQFIVTDGQVYIHGYRESREALLEYYEYISLESYVRMLCESGQTEYTATKTDDFWNYRYTDTVDGTQYTFLCVFYQTNEGFWRLQASCPTKSFDENYPQLWKHLISAH